MEQRKHSHARGAWKLSEHPTWLTEVVYLERIQPQLLKMTNAAIASHIGVPVLANDEHEVIDLSEETSQTLSETVSEETSQSGTPDTGDSGIITLVVISVISLIGAAAVKRK
jgi:hypothetical protein